MADDNKGLVGNLVDKVVVSVLVTAVASAAFYSFNAYNKAFENAQARYQYLTGKAQKLQESALEKTLTARSKVQSAYIGGKSLGRDQAVELRNLAGEIE